jgi:hypothetical protein
MAKHVLHRAGAALALALALALAVGFAAAAAPRSATLPQLFPELADLPESTGVAIGIDWMGLSPLSPMTADYILELHGDQFEGLGIFKVADAAAVKRAVAVPRDVVRGFLTAAGKVELVEAEYRAHIEHTDDYPSVDVEVPTKQGLLRIGSRSQQRQPKSGDYLDRTPWQIAYGGRSFVVTASDLDQAFAPFEPYLQDAKVFDEMWDDYNRKR